MFLNAWWKIVKLSTSTIALKVRKRVFTFSLEIPITIFKMSVRSLKGQALTRKSVCKYSLPKCEDRLAAAGLPLRGKPSRRVLVRDTWTDAWLPWGSCWPTPVASSSGSLGTRPGPGEGQAVPQDLVGPSASRRTWWSSWAWFFLPGWTHRSH